MAIRVGGDGPIPCPIMVVGERPGKEEVRARRPRPFIGPAGQELWARLWHVCGLDRSDVYCTNLVKTFSPKPPSREEVARDRLELLSEVLRVRPRLIVTVGYHAARFFLPQFEGVNGDYFHGLAFDLRYGKSTPGRATLVPVVHSSAALRSPGRYQQQLTEDLRAVREVLAGTRLLHVARVPPVVAESLATTIYYARTSGVLGLDTEGSIYKPWTPECVSLSSQDSVASLVNLHDAGPTKAARVGWLQQAIDAADLVTAHHFKHDIKALRAAGLSVPEHKWDDSMVMAYILNLPQGLKELSARLLGWTMSEYWDLVQPLDDALVSTTLKEYYDHAKNAEALRADATRLAKEAARQSKGARRSGRQVHRAKPGEQQAHLFGYDLETEAGPGPGSSPSPEAVAEAEARVAPTRALTSIHGILTKGAEKSRRDRWQDSKFSGLITLPPAPTWKDLPQSVRDLYALTDAVAHRTLRNHLWERIEREGLQDIYYLDMAVLPMLVRTEQVGMACDGNKLRALSVQFERDYEKKVAEIEAIVGHPVNPNSSDQVSDVLFNELGISLTNLTKSKKHYQTGDKYLKARRGEHDVIQLILDAKQLKNYVSRYTSKLPEMLQRPDSLWDQLGIDHADDERYYPDWKYTRTRTGRLAETIIVLIPKHDPMAKVQGRMNYAKAIRNCFHATRKHKLVSVDLSQIELRVMAEVSGDEPLLKAFRRGDDPHALVAHELLGAPAKKEDQDESAHRLPAKTLNFGIINGMSEHGMVDQLHEAGQLHWTKDAVKDLLAEWFSVHKDVKKFWDAQIREGREHGYVTSMHGRRSYVAGLYSSDERIVKETERQCLFKIQSSADEISKLWGRLIWKQIIRPHHQQGKYYCEPWVRVHDDTTLEVHEDIADRTAKEMLALVPQILSIPTPAEAKIGVEWGDLH